MTPRLPMGADCSGFAENLVEARCRRRRSRLPGRPQRQAQPDRPPVYDAARDHW